uniref:FYVE-type domain-containing protein n=3 Tax=Hemiselmis andersenii TaxID=464988 RepID=A0A7S1DXS6_HEMAN|mmetsp:Transcript_31626/g.77085  ORF Transcript_31626/g.77085 Transcript_31626/m.77085 type:complete len:412 (+) Transcript_31626:138-1373(+)
MQAEASQAATQRIRGAVADAVARQEQPKSEAAGAPWLRTGPGSPDCDSSPCSSRSSNSAASTWTQQPAPIRAPSSATDDLSAAPLSTASTEENSDNSHATPRPWDSASRRPPTLLDPGVGADAVTMLSPGIQERRCPRRLWQPDSDTDTCSMEACDTCFVTSFFAVPPAEGAPVSRRHHCRQCGRVVCSACSMGQKYLLNEDCKPGSGSMARVCNACMQGSETFNFRRVAVLKDKDANKNAILRRLRGSGGQSPIDNDSRRGSGASVSDLPEDQGGMKRNALSMPSLVTFFASSRKTGIVSPSTTSPSISPQDPAKVREMMASSSGDSDSGGTGTRPMSDFEDPGGVSGESPAQQAQPKEVAPVAPAEEEKDERLLKLEKELAASSYYQGLLRHEPAALKALTGLMTSTGN